MANQIIVKHRAGTTGDPSGLSAGELAGNILDKLFFIGTGAGNIVFADKSYMDTQLSNKADVSATYTRTVIDASLLLKANQATTYTKTEVDTKISDIIGGAPALLDTLVELSNALGGDENFATTMTSALATKLTDAPNDGSEYVRKNGAWAVVTSGGDISSATIDGGTY